MYIRPMIAKAAESARLVTLPETATYLSASRSRLAERAEWEDDSFSHQKLASMAREFSIWLLAGSLMMRWRDNGRMVNRSLLIGPTHQV